MGMLRLAAFGGASYAPYKYLTSKGLGAHPIPFERDAGPENLTTALADWSVVDEASDESFPASDPPAY